MLLHRGLVRAVGITVITLISKTTFAGFIDPRLEAWNSAKSSSLMTEQRKVIVFLNAQKFTDRSGMMQVQALDAERSDLKSYVNQAAQRLVKTRGNQFLGANNAEVLWSSRAFITNATRADVVRMGNDSQVEAVIENAIVTLEEPLAASKNSTNEDEFTYGLQVVHAPQAWQHQISGKDIVVGVIDTGVDANHPDLKGKIILQKDFTADNDNKDYHGHGTHVCGTIVGGNASGRHIGVAPNAKVIMAKVFDSKGQADTASLLKAMEFMLDPDGDPNTADAPKLVSNSWGANTQFFYGFRNVVQNWLRFDIFPNFAAGNSGRWFFTVNAPGSYPFSYAVAAIDENMNVTSFSSRGPGLKKAWPFMYTKPEISAPGLNVYSSLPDGKYEYYSGTSMATPHVAGVLALVLQANPNLKVADLQEILNTSALDRGNKGKDNRYGFGVVQADKAIERALAWKTKHVSSFQDKDPSQWVWDTP